MHSAHERFHVDALYKSTFYLLTYLLNKTTGIEKQQNQLTYPHRSLLFSSVTVALISVKFCKQQGIWHHVQYMHSGIPNNIQDSIVLIKSDHLWYREFLPKVTPYSDSVVKS